MADNKIKKVVLAYSGGLDTSIIIPWLKENYDNCEVIAVSGNVGQGTELDGLEEKAIKTGASKLYIEDLNKAFSRQLRPARFTRASTFSVHPSRVRLSQKGLWKSPRLRALTLSATVAQVRVTTRFVLSSQSRLTLPI